MSKTHLYLARPIGIMLGALLTTTLLSACGSKDTSPAIDINEPAVLTTQTTQTAQTIQTIQTTDVSLAGQWGFKIDPHNKGVDEQWYANTLNKSDWDRIAVPGVWDSYDRYNNYTGTAWYHHAFVPSSAWSDKQIRLVFESVYHDAEVWLNGQYLGENNLGFLSFKFDVTSGLNYDQTNHLIVKVNNRFKRGAVWNWGGIRRPVSLEISPKTRLERVYVTATPDLDTGTATLDIKTKVSSLESAKPLSVNIRIMREGELVLEQTQGATQAVSSVGEAIFNNHFNLTAEQVALWHFNHPNLYHVEVDLIHNDKRIHQLTDRFGIRKIEVDKSALYLNGEQVRLTGFNMVPEDRFDGNALPLSRIKEDVDLLKSLNGNMARLSGPILPKEYVDYLDEVGFLLIEEVGLWGKDRLVDPDHPLPKEWLRRLIDDHYNHPSVIAWSVGNEIGDLKKNPKVLEYVSGAIEHAKQLDPTRLGVYISYSADYQKSDPTQFSDIVLFNKYSDHEARLKVVHEYHPNKPIFFSEIGTNLDGVDPNESILDPELLFGSLRKYPYLIGTSHFAFSDYRSDWIDDKASWTTDYSQNRAWGVLTSYRQKKRSFKRIQNFNAPVETMELIAQENAFKVKITPRTWQTFPAFIMRDYRVAWAAESAEGTLLDAGVIELPKITPGDSELERLINTRVDFARLTVSLLDASGFVLKEVAHYAQLPAKAKVKSVFSSLDILRVTFEKSPLATEHQLVAIKPDGTKVMGKTTINDFAEVSGIESGVNYQLELHAINALGHSVVELGAATALPDELPPIIWAVKGKKDAFHIGFSVHRKDFRYEIEYGLAAGKYTEKFLLNVRGATRIPAIKAGKPHFFRMRRLVTGSVDSEWSDEYRVELRSDQGILPPNNVAAIKAKDYLLLKLTPVAGATGYRVTATTPNGEITHDTTLAYSEYIIVNDKNLLNAPHLRIASIDVAGVVGQTAPVILYE
ncbi:glycoside hydrolase family 2 protein [Algibacillus agarilyticus]|uniref:glycoside hydrolase family 2 protein n=1 Tax=Algibacillus agarilyticus TaxID=2234133 RepID=UPI000DCFF8DE|nr:sugar-binding domain-containing protein [Algibacillus agarilyticus]